MLVILNNEWMGRTPGFSLDLQEPMAMSLIERGTVREASAEEKKLIKSGEQSIFPTGIKSILKRRQMTSSPAQK